MTYANPCYRFIYYKISHYVPYCFCMFVSGDKMVSTRFPNQAGIYF